MNDGNSDKKVKGTKNVENKQLSLIIIQTACYTMKLSTTIKI